MGPRRASQWPNSPLASGSSRGGMITSVPLEGFLTDVQTLRDLTYRTSNNVRVVPCKRLDSGVGMDRPWDFKERTTSKYVSQGGFSLMLLP